MTPQLSASLVAVILIFLPLPWHWRHGNVATLSLIAWLFVANLIAFVNAYLWQDNMDIRALIWCDICRLTTI
jgi:pheromone a factor receptor